MKGRVLVTGATGMLGNNVVRALISQDWQVSVLVREGYDLACFQGLDVETLIGDLRDSQSLARACQSVEAIVHCAGIVQIGWSKNEGHQQVNVDGTRRIVEAASTSGARLVHVSSVNALSFSRETSVADEETPLTGHEVCCNYVMSKRDSDAIVVSGPANEGESLGNEFQSTIVYPGFMLGPWDWKPSSGKMLQELAAGKALLAPRGGCSVCDVRDVAQGIVACVAQQPVSRRYILAGHNVSYLELWRSIAETIGVRGPLGTFGPVVSRIAGGVGDLWSAAVRQENVVNSAAVRMSNCYHYYSSDLAQRELGYTMRPWRESVSDAWEWIQRYHSD